MADTKKDFEIDESKLEEMIAESDTGARNPEGSVGKLMLWVAFAWSFFQLWISSPFPYMIPDIIPVLNNTGTRSIHLAFAMFLGFLAYPAFKSSPRDHIPKLDWAFAIISIIVTLYLWVFARELADRRGLPTVLDLVISGIGIILVLEAIRRILGSPLIIIVMGLAYVFLMYLTPEVMLWKGASFSFAMSHLWIMQEGVFGVALGLSVGVIFPFVLFGSLLEKAGAGNYFRWLAFTSMGYLRGCAKSSVKVELFKSRNILLSASLLGVVAVLIEYADVPYIELIKYVFLPSFIFYFVMVYSVRHKVSKTGFEALSKKLKKLLQSFFVFMTAVIFMMLISLIVHYGFGWTKGLAGIVGGLFMITYLILLKVAAKYPDLGCSDEVDELPELGSIVKSGLYFLLPVIVLFWLATIERISPTLSAYWASSAIIFVLLTHKVFKGVMRGEANVGRYWADGGSDFKDAMVVGSYYMVGIAIVTAALGLVIGVTTL